MLEKLESIFAKVRPYLLEEGLSETETVRRNVKGQPTRRFDERAESLVIEHCQAAFSEPIAILSEECGEVRTRAGEPRYLFVLDPVDGSLNYARSMDISAVAIAVLPASAERTLQNVTHAMVGNVFTGTVFLAERGRGATRNHTPVRASPASELHKAVVGIDLGFPDAHKLSRVGPLLRSVKRVRSLGSAVTELALVASAGLDAHVDVRDALTAENFLAPGLLIEEAGGMITDPWGAPLSPVASLSQRFNVVASGNTRLHEAVLAALDMRLDGEEA